MPGRRAREKPIWRCQYQKVPAAVTIKGSLGVKCNASRSSTALVVRNEFPATLSPPIEKPTGLLYASNTIPFGRVTFLET
jgi:hypothetical protein